jgi:hypothetical protein
MVVSQKFLNKRRFSCLGEAKYDTPPVCQHPDIVVCSLNANPCLVDMNERTSEEPFNRFAFTRNIVFS